MFKLPPPSQQVEFSFALARARGLYLQDALGLTVETLDIAVVDEELARLAPKKLLAAMARHGLRGELVFAAPCVLTANPRLLAYYRLLLGYSQKEFFAAITGASPFKAMEAHGRLPSQNNKNLPLLCEALNRAAALLVEGIGLDRVTRSLLDDLTLLTFGPQLRGERMSAEAETRRSRFLRSFTKSSGKRFRPATPTELRSRMRHAGRS